MADFDLDQALRVLGEHSPEAEQAARTALARAFAAEQPGDSIRDRIRWTVAELYATEFPEPIWAVPDIIPVGLCLLAGKPKIGKSWLALQISQAVAAGGRVLDRGVEQGKVLHIALEDGPARLKMRLILQHCPANVPIDIRFKWPAFGEGGLIKLQAEIMEGGFRLVVLDTLSRIAGLADQSDVGQMTAVLGPLQQFALTANVTILMIDHHRKRGVFGYDPDPVIDILGSIAKGANPDAILGLYRSRGKRETTLQVVGRDLEDREFSLAWDPSLSIWQLLGDASQVRKDSLQEKTLGAIPSLVDLGQSPTTTNIAQYLDVSKGSVSHALGDLLQDGSVIKGDRCGKELPYYTPDTLPPTEQQKLGIS